MEMRAVNHNRHLATAFGHARTSVPLSPLVNERDRPQSVCAKKLKKDSRSFYNCARGIIKKTKKKLLTVLQEDRNLHTNVEEDSKPAVFDWKPAPSSRS